MAEEIMYATCDVCKQDIYRDKNCVWYHKNQSIYCYLTGFVFGYPIKSTITNTKPFIEDYSI